jgi:hypothetical protein
MNSTSVERESTPDGTPSNGPLLKLLGTGATAALAMLAVGGVFELMDDVTGISAEYKNNPAFRKAWWINVYFWIHPVWFGFVFAAGFGVTHGRPIGDWGSAGRWGAAYGGFLFVVGSLPIFALIYTSFNVSLELVIVSWAARNLVQYLVAGFCIGLVMCDRSLYKSGTALQHQQGGREHTENEQRADGDAKNREELGSPLAKAADDAANQAYQRGG